MKNKTKCRNSRWSHCPNKAQNGRDVCNRCWEEWKKDVKKIWGINRNKLEEAPKETHKE